MKGLESGNKQFMLPVERWQERATWSKQEARKMTFTEAFRMDVSEARTQQRILQ